MGFFSCITRRKEKEHYPSNIQSIRLKEYPSLKDTTYLDHAGTTIYPKSLIDSFANDMKSNLYGNPHSNSPSSRLCTSAVEEVRAGALGFFNADPQHFDLIFVANATAGIKLVMECFRDAIYGEKEERGFHFSVHHDAHTSLVGVREQAVYGSTCFTSDEDVDEWLAGSKYAQFPSDETVKLFGYPAQSNMNGSRLPRHWPRSLRDSTLSMHSNTYTLMDAAAYASTGYLDLGDADSAPDFIALSFYKIFGFPDLGALIVRKSAREILRRRKYFGGGTVDMVISLDHSWHARKETSLHEICEDGTLPFHNIIALGHAMTIHKQLYGSMKAISSHLASLSAYMYDQLRRMIHYNGQRVCVIYKDRRSSYGNSMTQGPTIAFNICTSQGLWVGKSEVEKLALERGIQLRTGGLCNPGGIASALGLSARDLKRNYDEGMKCGDQLDVLWSVPTGVVRVSLGAMSSIDDVQVLIKFIEDYFREDKPTLAICSGLCAHTMGSTTKVCPVVSCRTISLGGSVGASLSMDGSVDDDEIRSWRLQDC